MEDFRTLLRVFNPSITRTASDIALSSLENLSSDLDFIDNHAASYFQGGGILERETASKC
jgi:hypothetical protein